MPPIDTPAPAAPAPPAGGLVAAAMRSRISARLFGTEHAPTSIGRFEVRHVLGAGGMGIVYAATDPKLDRLVALKLLYGEHIADERQRDRLAKEARALAKLAHPNVVAIHEVGEHEVGLFIVMEHVDGVPLHHWQRLEKHTLPALLGVYLQAADGLQAAHAAGIIHRDFKPSNVLVGSDGRVRVADFGLARLGIAQAPGSGGESTSGSPAETTRSAVLGTPAYMSPEQSLGEVADAASDQFSFCVALWEAVFGVRPWEPTQVRSMALDPNVRHAPAVRGGGPGWLRRVLLRGLAATAAARWPSITDLQAAIRAGMRRRRQLAWGIGVAAVGVLGLFAARGFEQRCDDPSGALDGIWDESRASALQGHITADAPGFAQDALPSVRRRLDEYRTAWIAARGDSCEATYVRTEQSEEQFDRSVACLDRARAALGAGVDALVNGTPEVIAQAEALLDQLPSLESCRDIRVLRDGPVAPEPGVAAEVEDVQRTIDRANVLTTAGRVDEGLALGRAARDRAIDLAHAPTLAEATFALGQAHATKGDLAGARRLLFDAGTAAMGARSHELAVHAWHRLVALAADDLESAERSREWHALAGTAMGLGAPSAILAAEHIDDDALVSAAAGDYERAAQLHRTAADELARSVPADDLRVIQMERRGANALLNLGRHEEAGERYLELQRRVAGRFGSRHPEFARMAHNLALVAENRGDAVEAKQQYEAALDILTAAFGPKSVRVAPALTALGRLAMHGGDLERAAELGARAWGLQRDGLPVGHSERGSGLSLLAQVSMKRRALVDALTQHEELAIEYEHGPNSDQLPEIHQNIGWLLCELDRCTEARQANQRARELAPSGQPIELYIDAVTARIELADGSPVDAIVRLERILPDAEALSAADHPELVPELRWTLALALIARGRPSDRTRAIELVDQAAQGYTDSGTRPDALPKLQAQRRAWLELGRE